MKTKYKFIYFEQHPSEKDVCVCFNKKENYPLGRVEWDKQWKQFVFSPAPETQFSVGCMQDVIDFIGQLKVEK